MIHDMFWFFYMAKQHCGVTSQSQLMCLTSSVKPFFAGTFPDHYLFSSVGVKDFCAATWKRIKPCALEPQ